MKIWQGYQKGINLGGWFSQCDHSKERYDRFIRPEDFAVIRSWGADHVRIPVDYEFLEEADGAPREDGYERLSKVISLCRKNDLRMILDLHKTAGFSFDVGEGESGFFENEAYQERFYRLWETITRRLARHGDMLAFELLNEVTEESYKDVWNEISKTCIRRIRKIAPQITILVGGYHHNSVTAVKDLALPYDENIVYNFHCYEPHIFTHQGAYWMPTMDQTFRIPVTATFEELDKATKKMLGGSVAGLDEQPKEATLSAGFFKQLFAEAVRIAEERNVRLYCGEYGVIDRATPEDALSWYRMIHEAFADLGIGHAAWSYREMDFGLSDARMDGVREDLLAVL